LGSLVCMRHILCLGVLFTVVSCATTSPGRKLASSDGASIAVADGKMTTPLEVVQRLEQMETQLFATSGFADSTAIVTAANNAGGANAQAADLLMSEKVEVASALTERRRDDVLKTGFLNFRQVPGSSTGDGSGAVLGREIVEGNYVGLTGASYAQMDPAVKPKSAYLSPPLGSGLKESLSVSAYGEDRYIFKLSELKSRISVTSGDSLNRRIGMEDDIADWTPVVAWDQVYTPWSQRALMIPFLADSLQKNRSVGVPLETFTESLNQLRKDFPSQKEIERFTIVSGPADKAPNKPTVWASNESGAYTGKGPFTSFVASWGFTMDYIEVQIWGPLTMDDVSAFEITKTPPSGNFLAELKKRGIQIRDGRKSPTAIWKGS